MARLLGGPSSAIYFSGPHHAGRFSFWVSPRPRARDQSHPYRAKEVPCSPLVSASFPHHGERAAVYRISRANQHHTEA
ncbi:hypothetical protein CpMEX9_2150 [Corynebacterium pseudotuberculosis]|nr:hypothetical protein CpMEX9_2150 [Corynebacterium pseudotuberculosis]